MTPNSSLIGAGNPAPIFFETLIHADLGGLNAELSTGRLRLLALPNKPLDFAATPSMSCDAETTESSDESKREGRIHGHGLFTRD